MTRIAVTFRTRPDAVEEFRALTGELVKILRVEDGNLAYDLCVVRDNSASFVVFGIWRNDTAIEAHNASAHFTIPVPRMVGLRAEPLSVVQYTEV